MNCDSLRVVFAGTPEFAAEALDALIHSGHEVVGVLSQPDRPAGRGRKLTPSAVKQRALLAGIPVQQPVSLREASAVASLAELEPDVLVVAAYGLILPQAVLDLPALGCLNIHASLLPRWRGAAPIQRAILAGDTETGICIMRMDAGLDTGDVLLERRLMIGPDETAAELHDRLAKLGADCLLEALPEHCAGTLQARAQAGLGVSYAEKLSKSEGRLDFSDSALVLHRRVRAFNPWPVAEAVLWGERVRIWKSRLVLGTAVGQAPQPRVANVNPGTSLPGTIIGIRPDALEVSTGDGLIELLELQWPGRKVQGAAAFSQGRELAAERFTAA